MAGFAQTHRITDVCMLVADVERAIAFYTEKLGFVLRRRAEGFADFKGAGITQALWEIGHMAEHTGVSPRRATTRSRLSPSPRAAQPNISPVAPDTIPASVLRPPSAAITRATFVPSPPARRCTAVGRLTAASRTGASIS